MDMFKIIDVHPAKENCCRSGVENDQSMIPVNNTFWQGEFFLSVVAKKKKKASVV
jgi:hypothetical protein